jgi:hypothetical protein
MENNSENTSLDKTIKDSEVTPNLTIDKSLPYIPVEEIYSTPEYDAYIDTADVAMLQQLDQYKPFIDKYGVGAFANEGVARPNMATDTFDPVLQQNPPTFDNASGGFDRLMRDSVDQTMNEYSKSAGSVEEGTAIVSPEYSSVRQERFARYYNHPKFAELGFSPMADMESYYNANSTVYDDMARMWGAFGSLAYTGFVSSYRNAGDSGPDLQAANEFEDAMDIGMSSRDGGMAWTNNMLLNSAYTVGIMSSIALEELATAALTAVTFGGASPLLAATTAKNVGRLGKLGYTLANSTKIGRMASSVRTMAKSINKVDNARGFYKTGQFFGNMVAPETIAAIKSLKTAKNGAQNMSNMRKAATTFGGFYKDVRSLNHALSESKLEAGMTYNDMLDSGINTLLKENYGEPLSTEQMDNIVDKAGRAAFKTQLINAPLILLTNQLVLGNAFGGFNKSFARMANDKITGVGRRIIKTGKTVGKDGAKVLSPFADAGAGIKGVFKSVKNAGVKGNTLKAGAAGLRYFGANFGEGIQEVSQEAISHGVKDYYSTLLTDPMAGGMDLFNASVGSAVGSQFSAQGLDTFMSGFLMGGLVQGPQKLFFQGVPAIYNRVSDPKAYAEHKQNRENYVNSVVEQYNEAWDQQVADPNSVFDPKKFNFLMQKQAAGELKKTAFDGNKFGFIDAKDVAKFQQIFTVMSTGGAHYFEQQMKDYMNLSDEELGQAFPTNKAQVKSGKLRSRFQDMVNQIDTMETNYEKLKDKYENPFDESTFEKGTREYQDEAIKRLAFDHARHLYMFTQDGFNRAVERADSIYQALESEPLFKNMAASDLTVLLSAESMTRELAYLEQEIAILKEDKSQAGLVKEKDERKKRLEAIQSVLTNKDNIKADGTFDRRKMNLLKKDFHNYVRFMAKSAGSFVSEEKVEEALKQIVDHNALKGRARVYDKSIEYLNDPKRFDEIVNRTTDYMASVFKNIRADYKKNVEKYINVKEQNQLLNELAALGVTPDPDQVKAFADTADARSLTFFYTENGQVAPNDPLMREIKGKLTTFNIATGVEQEESEVAATNTEEAQAKENNEDINTILDENEVDIELSNIKSKLLDNALEKAYQKYSATEVDLGKVPKDYDQWIDTEQGQAFRQSYNAIKKIWIANDKTVNDSSRQLTQEQIDNDTNLVTWLNSQEGQTNDLVAQVLDKTGLVISDITGQSEEISAEGKKFKGRSNTEVTKNGGYVSLVEITTEDEKGNKNVGYQIIESSTGKPLSEEVLAAKGFGNVNMYLEKGEALKVWQSLESSQPDNSLFPFDGEQLHYGQKVYKDGIEYIVLSKPKTIATKGVLLLIPADAQTLSYEEKKAQEVFVNVREGAFKDFYTLQEIKVDILGKNVSRINFNEPVTPYGHRNMDPETGQWTEDWNASELRFYSVLAELTQADIDSLEFVVELDPNGGSVNGQYFIPKQEANPYIKKKVSKYRIGLRVSNPMRQDAINKFVKENGHQANNNPNGIFAYLPNENTLIEINGQKINPAQLTADQARNLISMPKSVSSKLSKEQALELAKSNFVTNQTLVAAIDSKMKDAGPGPLVLTQEELPYGISFNSILGNILYDNVTNRKLTDLDYSAADTGGNFLIYQAEKGADGRTTVAISNLEGEERRLLIDNVEEKLKSQGIFDDIQNGSDAYLAAVLLPDGTYRLVPLKSKELSKDNADVLFANIISQAQKSQKENKENNKAFNKAFNDKTKSELFITGFDGLGFTLKVNQFGKIQLAVTKTGVEGFTNFELNKADINKEGSAVDKIQILIDKANKSDILKKAVSSPETGSKVGMTLTMKNFKASFARIVSAKELLEKTTTNAQTKVVGISQIELNADSAASQSVNNANITTQGVFTPTEEYTDANGNPIPSGPEMQTASSQPNPKLTSEEVEFGLLDIEQEDFDNYKANEFKDLPTAMFEHITNKIVKSGEEALVEREKEVYAMRRSEIDMRVAMKGGPAVTAQQTSEVGIEAMKADIERRKNEERNNLIVFKNGNGGYTVKNPATGETGTGQELQATLIKRYNDELASLSQPTTESTNNPLNNINEELNTLRNKLQEGKKGKAKRKALLESEEYQDLLKKKRSLESEANKIMPAFTAQDSENIDVFTTWAIATLPSFISIEDIATLGNNLKAGGERVGAFTLNLNALAGGTTISGTLYTGAKSPFRYHEAFHGVFRMLLTDVEIKKYLAIARKEVRAELRAEGKNFKVELQKFRNSADTYSEMSESRLEQEYYEEYLADKFEEFKQNPKQTKTDSSVKSLFTRILEWIKSVFNSYTKNELSTLFENIDAGKYQTAAVTSNQFTNTLITGTTLEANALIPYSSVGEGKKKGFYFLDSVVADPMIRSIGAMYLSRASKVKESNVKRSDLLDTVLDDFYDLYDPENQINLDKTDLQKEILSNITLAIDDYSDLIKDQVYNILNVIDGQVDEEVYNTEYFEDTVGLRGSDQWNTDASQIGGLQSTPKLIRAYFATTTKESTDFFGNSELVSELKNDKGVVVRKAERLIVPVNFQEVYNGLLKSVKNIDNPRKMLQSMYFFGQDNLETGAVVARLLKDIGVSVDTLLEDKSLPLTLEDPQLFQSITKAFENFRVDYLFTQRDAKGNVIMFSASERDDINSQVDRWSQAWNNAYKKIKSDGKFKENAKKTLEDFGDYINPSENIIEDAKLSEISKKYSEKIFQLTGIKLSRQYIAFSIAKNRPRTREQEALNNLHAGEVAIEPDVVLTMNTLIQQEADIFSDGKDGMNSRIKTLAINNGPFDETIGLSVFKNSEGNLVYAHQKPTFHLKQIEALNADVETLERIKEENPYLENNHLLNSEAFKKMSAEKRHKILRIAGTAVGEINTTEAEITENISGVTSRSTYGNFTPQEFALNLLNTYTASVNTKSGKVDTVEYTNESGVAESALSPTFIRVLESSNTGDMTKLPVIKAVKFKNGNAGEVVLTKETVDVFVNAIETEYKRIQRESNSETATAEQIIGYNINENDRAFKLHNSSLLLSPDSKARLEEFAVKSEAVSFSTALSTLAIDVNSEVEENLESQFTEFQTLIAKLNIQNEISNSVKNGLVGKGVKPTPSLIESNELLNLTYDSNYNLKQIFFNNWVNTKALNEILLGDQAVTLKNGVDAIKRAKAQNAATISAYSAITAPKLGVNHTVEDISLVALEEPIGESSLTGENIDKADAQMWMTSKAGRYMSFGFGQLTPSIANLYNKIEQGEDITSWQIFGENVKVVEHKEESYIVKDLKIFDRSNIEVFKTNSADRRAIFELARKAETVKLDGYVNQSNAMLNSKKLVYFDGTSYIKMSAFVLTPALTSNKVVAEDGSISWVAKPNRVELHNLRVKLEAIESSKNTISIAAPLTALKMLKQKVQTLERINEDALLEESDYTNLSAKNMGLQVETPSNKMETVDPTQIKAIVTSEQKDDVFVEALNMNVGQIREAYNLAIGTRIELNFKNKRNLIFSFDNAMDELKVSITKDKLTPNLMSYLRYAQEGLKASQSSSQLLEFFSIENGEQKYDLNNPITINKFEQLFLSYLSKGTLAEKQPGHSLALVSDFGMNVYRRVFSIDENGTPDRSEVIRENVWDKMSDKQDIVALDTLTNDNIPKGGVVIIDRLRSGLKEYDSKGEFTGQRYTEMLMPAHFKSVMDLVENGTMEMPEVLSKMFGIRIPSQDNHSTINIKHVDFLPAYYGSSASFAQELVEISGADFDIDKIFAQIKEFYVRDNKFIEYGKAKSDPAKYEDYINYVNEKVKKPGTIYSEAYALYKTPGQAARLEASANTSEVESGSDAGFNEDSIKALQMLGLPISKQQYINYKKKNREPYSAPMNNAILDYKYALMGNRYVTEESFSNETPISYTAASLNILESELADLAEISDLFKSRIEEDTVDIDNLLGQVKAFEANKGAAIGAIVSPNVNLSLLTEYGIILKGLALKFNGQDYNDFGVLREIKSITYTSKGKAAKTYIIKDNKIFNTSNIEVFKTDSVDRSAILMMAGGAIRKQDIISSLITMATDNAKERLVAKLGLNKSALSLVGNLTALGVPIRTSLLLINNPTIADIYSTALNKKDKLDPGVDALVKAKLNELKLTMGSKNPTPIAVTDKLLLESINETGAFGDVAEFSILSMFQNALEVKNFTSKMISVSGLTTGLGQNISDINKVKEDLAELFAPDAIMDLTKIYKGKTWQSKVVEIFKEVSEEILPSTFLSASESFQDILSETLESVDTSNREFDAEALAKVSRDLLSYVTIKSYMHKQLNNNSQAVATLNNNLIYPSDYESINDIIERMRESGNGKDNFFLDNFVASITADDQSNQTGLNKADANTFRSLNSDQKVDLQTSFAKLYGSLETKNDALSILNYIMVKDGLQPSSNTLLDALSPFIMEVYLSQIEGANIALRDRSDSKMESMFGLTFNQLKDEFIKGYLIANRSNALLQTFNSSEGFPLTGEIKRDVKEKTATVSWNEKKKIGKSKEYFRIGFETETGMDYVTYKRVDGSQNDYIEVDTVGSNQQNPIGFMFGPLPTYKDVRKYVREKNIAAANEKTEPQEQTADSIVDEKKAKIERVLQDENVNVIATEKSIDVIEEDGTKENISDAADVQSNSVNRLLNIKPKTPTPQASEVEVVGRYANADVKANPNKIYIFGDNTQRIGTGGQAQIRNNENAFGIATKLQPNNSASAFMSDNSLQANKDVIDSDIAKIKADGRSLVFPKDGFGTGLAKLKEKAPKTYAYLKQRLQQEFGFNNDTGVVSKPTQKTSEVESELLEAEESVTPLDAQLDLDLFKAISDEYSALTNYWDSTMKDKEKMDKLRQNNILSLADMIKDYKAQGQDQTEEEYIESLGCL